MRLFRRKRAHSRGKRVRAIKRGVLELIFEAARDSYPNEFMGMLRAEGDTIVELILLPGTTSGESHAVFYRHMLPVDFSIMGTVHSHPSSRFDPSGADSHLFQRYGRVHIISARPYDMKSWGAYNERGEAVRLEVV